MSLFYSSSKIYSGENCDFLLLLFCTFKAHCLIVLCLIHMLIFR
jgi:hypothetical protein